MDSWFYEIVEPEKFDSTKSLLTRMDKRPDKCQNIQPDRKPSDISDVYSKKDQITIDFNHYIDYPDVSFLDFLQQICITADAKECRNEGCQEIRRKMNAPACEWKPFRDWVLMVMACLMHSKVQKLEVESQGCWKLVVDCIGWAPVYRDDWPASENLFEICELINWMLTITDYPLYNTSSLLIRRHISKRKIIEATQTADEVGICKSRLWNLAVAGGRREEVDLPMLMMPVAKNPDWFKSLAGPGSENHKACTEEVCCFSNIDSTRVEQLHKCLDMSCGEPLRVPPAEIKSSHESLTWWTNEKAGDNVLRRSPPEKYMAISHVWSDGTGAGIQDGGRVNRCLFNYFKGIAKELGCTAIWWDTISIPTEKTARQNAIGRMHENFRQATHTIVHDQHLVQLPWTDDGGPCLALLLSPWFTRAWTFLELVKSGIEKVSVIYRHPTYPCQYTIKNLKRDILVNDPAYCSRSHWLASSLINQLCAQRFDSIGNILKVLRTRSTSWPRDIMVIAGLLTSHNPKVNMPGFIAHTTRNIILGLVEIEQSFLYHGHSTMTHRGSFSWCPFSLLDGNVRNNASTSEWVYVDEDGTLSGGNWLCRILSKKDAENLQPYSFHISADWRVRSALEQSEHCLLLRIPQEKDSTKALLVAPQDVGICKICDIKYVVLECQYVGTVDITNIQWDDRFMASIRLGKLTGDPRMSAKEIITKYKKTKGPRISGHPWKEHLHSIRQSRRQNLA